MIIESTYPLWELLLICNNTHSLYNIITQVFEILFYYGNYRSSQSIKNYHIFKTWKKWQSGFLQRQWQNSAIQYSNEITLRKEIVAIEGKVGKRMPERIFISMSYFPIYRYLDSKCSHRRLHYTHLYIYIFILSRQSTNSTEQDSPRAEMNNTHFFVINVTCIGDIK